MLDAPHTPIESALTIVFNALAFLGVLSTAFVLAPAVWSSRIKRPRIWFGVLTSYLVYSVIYLLLVGRQYSAEPSPGLCFFQAILIYGTVPVCGVSTACFAIDFFLKLSILRVRDGRTSQRTSIMLARVPWIFGLMVTIVSALVIDDASIVRPDVNHFYCHITNSIPSLINSIIILLCGLFINALQIYTAVVLYRSWAVFRHLSRDRPQIAFSTFIRLSLFSLIVTIAIVLSIITATNQFKDTMPGWSIMLVTLPTFAALCFGARRDILQAWFFWRREESIHSYSTTALNSPGIDKNPRMSFDV